MFAFLTRLRAKPGKRNALIALNLTMQEADNAHCSTDAFRNMLSSLGELAEVIEMTQSKNGFSHEEY